MQQTTLREEMRNEVGSAARSMAVLAGVLQIILGLFLIAAPGMTTLVLIQFLGIYWLALGVISIIQIFTKRSNVHWGWLLVSGALGIIAGFAVLQHPFFGAVASLGFLTYFIVFTGLLRGVVSIVQGIGGEGAWSVILGVVLLLVSLYFLFNPLGALIALPLVIGIFALVGGLVLVFAGIGAGRGAYSGGGMKPRPM